MHLAIAKASVSTLASMGDCMVLPIGVFLAPAKNIIPPRFIYPDQTVVAGLLPWHFLHVAILGLKNLLLFPPRFINHHLRLQYGLPHGSLYSADFRAEACTVRTFVRNSVQYGLACGSLCCVEFLTEVPIMCPRSCADHVPRNQA